MKTIKVTLTGHCEVFLLEQPVEGVTAEDIKQYDYMVDLEDDEKVDGNMIELAFIKEIGRLTWREYNGEDDEEDREFGEPLENEEPIVKKGKYIKTGEYFAEFVKEPFVVQHSDNTYAEFDYLIELDSNEEFDPMKLQLIKSDYEVEFLPYGIITSNIMYDGRVIPTCTETGFDIYAESGCFLYEGFVKRSYPQF